jgi:hypothetical protein
MHAKFTVRDRRALDDGAEERSALREAEALESTADGVDEHEPGGLERELAGDVKVVDVVGDVLEDPVRRGPVRGLGGVGHGAATCERRGLGGGRGESGAGAREPGRGQRQRRQMRCR